MGSNNSRNPVYKDNGQLFKEATGGLYEKLEIVNRYIRNGGDDKRAYIAHDNVLAEIAAYSAVILSHDYMLHDRNMTARDYSKHACNLDIFNKAFDYHIKAKRGY